MLLRPSARALMDTTQADEVAEKIEELIISGALAPGTVLRQAQLAERFGVSRTPIREALRKLAALDLVSFAPNRGVRVRGLDRAEYQHAFMARATLEGLAAELAATNISDEALEELEQVDSSYQQLTLELREPLSPETRSAMSHEWLLANHRFHDIILQECGSPMIARLAKSVRRVFSGEEFWTPGSKIDQLNLDNVRQHVAIRAALASRSPLGARTISYEHVMHAWRLMLLILDTAEERRGP
jgi:DNA-binding GntR family transcriptional regulator